MRVAQPNEKEISHGRQSRRCFHFTLHNSSLRAAACRGSSIWLGVCSYGRWYCVRSGYHGRCFRWILDTLWSLSHSQAPRNYKEHRTLLKCSKRGLACAVTSARNQLFHLSCKAVTIRAISESGVVTKWSPPRSHRRACQYRRRLDDPFNSGCEHPTEDQSFGCLNCSESSRSSKVPGVWDPVRSQIFLVRLPSRHQIRTKLALARACRRSSSVAASHCSTALIRQ